MSKTIITKIITLLLFASVSLFATSVNTSKLVYNPNEPIKVTVSDMSGNYQDWIGIYPANASNAWGNVLSWRWSGGIRDGKITLDTLPIGNYEARAFFNNSFNLEASYAFSVQGNLNTDITTSKESYNSNEPIKVTINGMLGNYEDWVGIYPANASNAWGNVLSWRWSGGIKDGTITLDTLPAGSYEARAFFSNSFNLESSYAFSVKNGYTPPTIYENAENGISAKWSKVAGNYTPKRVRKGYNSRYCVKLMPQWISKTKNISVYRLETNNASQRILELDAGGAGREGGRLSPGRHGSKPAGWMPHYFVGAIVMTRDGKRSMIWDSYFNHENMSAFRADYGNGFIELAYPSPVELVRGWDYEPNINKWNHFKVDLEASLKLLEPNNTIISVIAFHASGGYLDNIKLSSNP